MSVRKNKAFTLVEMMVVIAIVLILVGIGTPAVSSMWRQANLQNANQTIGNLIKTAKARSAQLPRIAYGILFYIEPNSDREVAVFISALPYPITPDEKWPDVRDRFVVDVDSGSYSFPMKSSVRIAQPELLEWIGSESPVRRFWAENNDYRAGNQRNFFAIIFQGGKRAIPRQYVLYDEDIDEDGLGDILGLTVGDVDEGGVLRDIVVNEIDERRLIPTSWGFLIYDEDEFKESSPNDLDLVSFLSYNLTRDGKVIELEREK